MRLRFRFDALLTHYIDVVQCECCHDLVPATTDPLDAHGHCPMCQEPREKACTECETLTREDLIDGGLCPQCALDDELDRERMAAEE